MNDLENLRTFILGVDGGGTKTIARLINIDTEEQWQASTGPSSLTNDYNTALRSCQSLIEQLRIQANCLRTEITVVFGLAGAGHIERANEFKRAIPEDYKEVEVYTDAKISLYGANEGNPIAVVSLGTGSVGAALTHEGKEIQIGGWGFNVGDEGSGAKMGVLIVKSILAEIEDFGGVNSLLAQMVVQKIGGDFEAVLPWSTSAKPTDFASLAPLVFELHGKCHLAKSILIEHVRHVESLITKTRANLQLPVVLLGGLSTPTMPFLSTDIKNMLVKEKGNALDGACFLAKKLAQKNLTGYSTYGS
ncbi:BadF/BadG/BcrA/BcrD ATPase family protein [Thalassotalea piscium]|uniref:Glucosamine kinase n=1 Tax=Thalassotalea piscium TaxID=1230533 RepID=A0A7X0NFP4_9GAMM|nr:BadF/BadG/BcrA/BcrD ATPase family protein [Thalassotalea piscium]MBB6542421.1 glucosamine kinase [Thalassotalea piscium]